MGKVKVKDNQIVESSGVILKDGSLKKMGMKFNARYKETENPALLYMDITNGMPSSFLTDDNRIVNVFLY